MKYSFINNTGEVFTTLQFVAIVEARCKDCVSQSATPAGCGTIY